MKRILVAFYSHTGKTKKVAKQIHSIVGGDVYEIIEQNQYPRDFDTVVEQAKHEIAKGYQPTLKGDLPEISEYDVIFVGSPNWWNTIAPPLSTFLSSADFTGKTIIPFITHGGGGLNRTISDIEKLAQDATVLNGFDANNADHVSEWLKTLNLLESQ
ncbi:MAG: flavodoxin [Candidatus Cloacimonetes bacterium]|nr:flavodoxin [Candidatus Cloacimonadota bacterium]